MTQSMADYLLIAALVAVGVGACLIEMARQRREERRYPRGRPLPPEVLKRYQRDDAKEEK